MIAFSHYGKISGQPSRYSVNELYQNYMWQIDYHDEEWKAWADKPSRNALINDRELGPDGSDYQK
jgi:hypothetical protein